MISLCEGTEVVNMVRWRERRIVYGTTTDEGRTDKTGGGGVFEIDECNSGGRIECVGHKIGMYGIC